MLRVSQYQAFKLFGFLYFSSKLKVEPFVSLAYWGSKKKGIGMHIVQGYPYLTGLPEKGGCI